MRGVCCLPTKCILINAVKILDFLIKGIKNVIPYQFKLNVYQILNSNFFVLFTHVIRNLKASFPQNNKYCTHLIVAFECACLVITFLDLYWISDLIFPKA